MGSGMWYAWVATLVSAWRSGSVFGWGDLRPCFVAPSSGSCFGCGGRREVAHCVNNQPVDFRWSLAGKTAQIRFDPDAGDFERLEKVLAQEKVADRLIVGIKP